MEKDLIKILLHNYLIDELDTWAEKVEIKITKKKVIIGIGESSLPLFVVSIKKPSGLIRDEHFDTVLKMMAKKLKNMLLEAALNPKVENKPKAK